MRTLDQVEDRVSVFQLIEKARGWSEYPLTARELKVLLWRYGFLGAPLTLKEVGAEIGVSASRARQIEFRARIKLEWAAKRKSPAPHIADMVRYLYWQRPTEPARARPRKPVHDPDRGMPLMDSGTIRLTCDDCSKRVFQRDDIYHFGGYLKRAQLDQLRSHATDRGWMVAGGRDICPMCVFKWQWQSLAVSNPQHLVALTGS